jgi:hypothetical protein
MQLGARNKYAPFRKRPIVAGPACQAGIDTCAVCCVGERQYAGQFGARIIL